MDDLQLLVAFAMCFVVWMWVSGGLRLAHVLVKEDLSSLFQPQWQREADYLAQFVPCGDAWS